MTYRNDLAQRNRELRNKIETMRSVLLTVDKKISDAVQSEISGGHQPDLDWLNSERQRLWNELKEAKDVLAEVDAEKNALFRTLVTTGVNSRSTSIVCHALMPIWRHGFMGLASRSAARS